MRRRARRRHWCAGKGALHEEVMASRGVEASRPRRPVSPSPARDKETGQAACCVRSQRAALVRCLPAVSRGPCACCLGSIDSTTTTTTTIAL